MRRKVLSILLLAIALSDQIACEEGFFTVVGSHLIKLGKVYRASLAYQGYESDKTFEIGLKNKADGKDEMIVSKNVTIKGNGVQFVDLDTKNQPEGDYVLEVNSDNFTRFQKLHLNRKQLSVFVQTDKSIYKPSDNVQFRVVIVDAETRPLDTSNVEIYITDGADNRVKQFENVKLKKGVFQNELQLSDLPVMGTWKIHVKVNNEEETVKEFEVAEYVLPKFEVSIDANPDANYKDGKIKATVKATYTFGKVAKGNATVTAEVESWAWWRNKEDNKKVSKTVEVDGKKFVEFDIEKDLDLKDKDYEKTITLSATFTDELSGKEANATTKVKIHPTRHKIDLTKSADKFKPGLPYKVTALARFHDKNMPVNDKHNPLKFIITYYYDILKKCKRPKWHYYHRRVYHSEFSVADSDSQSTTEDPTATTAEPELYDCRDEKSFQLETEIFLKNGVAEISIDMPSNTTRINVKAKYLETEEQLYHISRAESESDEYILAKVLTEKPSLNEQVKVEVLTTKEVNKLSYQIIGKGNLIESKIYESATNEKRHVLSFIPKITMIPKSHLIVYYITSDGEIISDKIDIEFGNELINYVNLQLSSEQAKPGETLNITVSSRPNSYVGLLGVDQSVLLLKKGNDIDPSTVYSELDKYGHIDKYNYEWHSGYDYRSNYDDFSNANAVVITNAKKEVQRPYIPIAYDHEEDIRGQPDVAYSVPLSASFRKTTMGASMPVVESNAGITTTRRFEMQPAMVEMDALDSDRVAYGGSASAPSPPNSRKPIEVRKEFPETWLFDNLEFEGNEKQMSISKKVPDTITSWIITGFSIDPITGLGLTKQPSKFNVFQPFFVSTNLPYSIKRGEVVAIPIIVFNYMENDQTAEVTLFNDDKEFEFVEINDDENAVHRRKRRALDAKRKKTVLIKSNDGVSVSFMIRPLKVGQITIKVTAESDIAGDGVERQLRVEPEGVTQYLNEAVFIDLRNQESFKTNLNIFVPNDAVPDSTRVEASAVGDILGPSIENLDKLIKLPYGCGEQNMLNFVPNIVVLEYLTNLNKLNPQIESKAKKYMESGYQRELTYKHDDGSYSAFGKSDNSGSTWLTAFVAKSFNQASKYILVDEVIVKEALDFLKKVQSENGSFVEVGHVSHKDMQGGSSKGIALTAYTLITFLENKKLKGEYENTINKAANYIASNFDNLNDNYSLAIASYALQLAGHPANNKFLAKLSTQSEDKDGMKYWKKEQVQEEDTNPWYHKPNSVNVEMSAYALQAYLEAGRDGEGVPIMKWLVTQRNENGGFQSTQDTVVGLQALSKMATKIYVPNSELTITVKPQNANPTTININAKNSLILQKHELSPEARNFEVSATGRGFSILQIAYRYNLDDSGKYPRFILKPTIKSTSNKEFLHLSVCTNFVPDAQTEKSNMAVMEVTLPSGFTFDSDHLPDLLATERVKKVETKDGETVVIVYFDDIAASQICPEFKAYRTHGVAKQKPAPIIIYDYYDNARHARSFYNPPEISLCDICADQDECRDACEVEGIQTD